MFEGYRTIAVETDGPADGIEVTIREGFVTLDSDAADYAPSQPAWLNPAEAREVAAALTKAADAAEREG